MTKVTLSAPVARGEGQIAHVTLRAPRAGELRGLKLLDVMQMDVGALIRLVPRIAEPGLTEDEVAALPLADLTRLGVAVAGFFEGVEAPGTPTT